MRPTSDRLKESLFNILMPAIDGAILLDAFGGTGAIGIEALSRGARQVVFIESSPAGCRLIRKNLETCGIATGFRIVSQDAFAALRALARDGFRPNIVYFDPPYDFKPYRDLLEIVFRRLCSSASSLVIIEHGRRAELPESGDAYRRTRLVRQGDHCLSFYEAVGVSEPATPSSDE